MEAYETNRPAYFATPPVNLIYAYRASLELMLRSPTVSLVGRLEKHKETTERIRREIDRLGLKFVAEKKEERANGMTAVSLIPRYMNCSRIDRGSYTSLREYQQAICCQGWQRKV